MAAALIAIVVGAVVMSAGALGCVFAFTDWLPVPAALARFLRRRRRGSRKKSRAASSASALRRSERRSSKGRGSVDSQLAVKKKSVFAGVRRRLTSSKGAAAATTTADAGGPGSDHRDSEALLNNYGLGDDDDLDQVDGGGALFSAAAALDGDDHLGVDLSNHEDGDNDDDDDDQLMLDGDAAGKKKRGKRSKRAGDAQGAATSAASAFMSGALRGVTVLAAAPVVMGSMAAEGAQNLSRRNKGFPSFRALRGAHAADGEGSDAAGDDENEDSAREQRRRRHPSAPALGARFPEQLSSHALLKSSLKAHPDLTTAVAFSPNGQYVATAGGDRERTIRLLVRATLYGGEGLTRFQTVPVPVDDDWIASLAFSQDGFFLVAGTGNSSQVAVFRIFGRVSAKPALECVFDTQHSGPVRHVYMSTAPGEDAHFLCTAGSEGDATLKFWSFGPKPKLLFKQSLAPQISELTQLRFSASGKLLAVVGTDGTDGEDADADAAAGPPSRMVVFSVQFAQRGGFRKQFWTVSGLQRSSVPAAELEGVSDVDFGARSATAALLLGASWRLARVKEARLVPLGHYDGPVADGARFSAVAYCEGRRMVVAARGADLYFFRLGREASDAARLVEVVRRAHDSRIRQVLVAPDDEYVMSLGANSESARLWKFPTGTIAITPT